MEKDRGKISPPTVDIPIVKIKQEPTDDIKNYAETTMNELLGWYGYDGVSSMETENLNLTKYRSSKDKKRRESIKRNISSDNSDDSDDSLPDDESVRSSEQGETVLAAQHRNLVSALTKRHTQSSGSSDSPPSPQYIVCGWCQKPGLKLFSLKTPTGLKLFCSELCFTQCRRASFKKNKICDWCKHVRHTVNYVELQDGDIQFQFCSEKCLSQYKMNLFCRETREHLNKIKASESEENNNSDIKDKQILITPELWLHEPSDIKSKDSKDLKDDDEIPRKVSLTERSSTITSSDSESRSRMPLKQPRTVRDLKFQNEFTSRKSRGLHPEIKEKRRSVSPGKRQEFSPKPPAIPNGPLLPPWFHPQQFMGQGLMNHPLLYGMSPFTHPFAMPPASNDNRSESRGLSTPLGQNSVSPSTSVCSSDSNPPVSHTNGGLPTTPRNIPPPPPPPFLHMGYPHLPFPQFNHGENMFGGGVLPFPTPNPVMSNPMLSSGTPPVTVMVPFPVVLPVPVPIPLPLPISAEKLEAFFKEKAEEEREKQKQNKTPTMDRDDASNRSKSAEPSRSSSSIKQEHTDGCLQCAACTSGPSRSLSRNSVDIGQSQRDSLRDVYSHKVKRSLTPSLSLGSNLTKKAKIEVKSDSDGAIDLSKDSMRNFLGKENHKVPSNTEESKLLSDVAEGEYMLKIPRIHIVNPENVHSIEQSLPLPDTNYSSRRSRILDAPNVPKREQSPSPERRYVRTVSRDMVEAARRRCLRARVKSK